MDFVRFHATSGDGRIARSGLITADSSNTFMEWFFAGFARVTGKTIDEEDRKKVYQVGTFEITSLLLSMLMANFSS